MNRIDFEPFIKIQEQIKDRLSQRASSPRFGELGLTGKNLSEVLTWARDTKSWYETGQPNDSIYRYAQGLLSLTSLSEQQASLLEQIAQQARDMYPETPFGAKAEQVVTTAAVLECDLWTNNPQRELIIETILDSLACTGKINLLTFVCPEVDFQYLTGPNPSYYIRNTARKNSFDLQWQRNRQMFRLLTAAGYSIKLDIIVGELDEESYIFPVLGNYNTDPEVLASLRSDYRQTLLSKLSNRYGEIEISVTGWADIAPESPPPLPGLPSMNYLNEEIDRMRELMKPGKYYDGVFRPTPEELSTICQLKMQTYAIQGMALKSLFPYSIGLQNEYPARLRTLMLNSGLISQGRDQIPFIYPYKITL
jgi:hypothetical protein